MSQETPFGCTHPEDMFIYCREELFVISALVEAAASHGDTNFRDADATNALLAEAKVRLRDLIPQCKAAADYCDVTDPARQAIAA